jgi:molecular chaperone GrpE
MGSGAPESTAHEAGHSGPVPDPEEVRRDEAPPAEGETGAAPSEDEAAAEGPAADSPAGDSREADGPAGDGAVGGDDDKPLRAAERVLLKRYEKERDDFRDQYQRTRAEFENYRKRMVRQQTEQAERAAEGLVEQLLPALDNFDAAISHGTGFEQARASMLVLLEKQGLERIDPVGQPFDPAESDAVAHEDGDGGPVVAEVLRPGYRWKGRVLRPAMVRVRG